MMQGGCCLNVHMVGVLSMMSRLRLPFKVRSMQCSHRELFRSRVLRAAYTQVMGAASMRP